MHGTKVQFVNLVAMENNLIIFSLLWFKPTHNFFKNGLKPNYNSFQKIETKNWTPFGVTMVHKLNLQDELENLIEEKIP